VVDEIRVGNWLFVSANSKSKVKPPIPIRRPGLQSGRRRRQMTAAELKEIDPRLRELPDEEAVAKFREMTGRD